MSPTLRAYLAQPTTIAGLSGLAATVTGVAAHLILRDTTVTAAIAAVTMSVVRVVLPDNSAAQTSIEKLLKDALEAEVNRRVTIAMPLLFGDATAVAQTLAAPAPAAPAAPAAPVAT